MLHHLSFSVSDLNKSANFYDAVLKELGYTRVWTAPDAVGYGIAGGEDKFAIKAKVKQVNVPSPGFHVAFAADNRNAVNAFYRTAIVHGAKTGHEGKDTGEPGLRPKYGPGYYAAFVRDLDNYPIEAVIIEPV